MTQIAILSGIYTTETPDYRIAYPRNMVPVPRQQGISNGYLKPAEGIKQRATGRLQIYEGDRPNNGRISLMSWKKSMVGVAGKMSNGKGHHYGLTQREIDYGIMAWMRT